MKHQHNHGPAPPDDDYFQRTPSFSYEFPEKPATDDAIPFAISPADPRFYDSTNELRDNYDRSSQDDNVQYAVDQNKLSQSHSTDDNVSSYKMKAPMEVKPKTNNNLSSKSMDVFMRNDLKLLYEELQKNGQEDVIINSGLNGRFRSDVIKKHMEMDSAMGMYVVALIAGVSAAGKLKCWTCSFFILKKFSFPILFEMSSYRRTDCVRNRLVYFAQKRNCSR